MEKQRQRVTRKLQQQHAAELRSSPQTVDVPSIYLAGFCLGFFQKFAYPVCNFRVTVSASDYADGPITLVAIPMSIEDALSDHPESID